MREKATDSKYNGKNRRLDWVSALKAHDLSLASDVVSSFFGPTPVEPLPELGSNAEETFLAKIETKTPTGSFKIRGAAHFLSKQIERNPAFTELVTASTGNHGIGLCWVAKKLGKAVTVVVPEGTPTAKTSKLSALGATLKVEGKTLDETIEVARSLSVNTGATFVPAFNPEIILGHSTMGTELFRQRPDLSAVFFPIGVGSGILGLSISRDIFSPHTKIYGVVPEACCAWKDSFEIGSPVSRPIEKTIADGLRTMRPDGGMWDLLHPRLAGVLSVTESEIEQARLFCQNTYSVLPEGAGAVAIAGMMRHARKTLSLRGHVASIICG